MGRRGVVEGLSGLAAAVGQNLHHAVRRSVQNAKQKTVSRLYAEKRGHQSRSERPRSMVSGILTVRRWYAFVVLSMVMLVAVGYWQRQQPQAARRGGETSIRPIAGGPLRKMPSEHASKTSENSAAASNTTTIKPVQDDLFAKVPTIGGFDRSALPETDAGSTAPPAEALNADASSSSPAASRRQQPITVAQQTRRPEQGPKRLREPIEDGQSRTSTASMERSPTRYRRTDPSTFADPPYDVPPVANLPSTRR